MNLETMILAPALQSIRILARGAELAKAIEPQRSGGHRETLDDASLCPPASLWFKAASPLVAAAPRCDSLLSPFAPVPFGGICPLGAAGFQQEATEGTGAFFCPLFLPTAMERVGGNPQFQLASCQ